MPKGNEDAYELMMEMAKQLRQMADAMDKLVEDAYRGEDEDKFGSSGDVEEDREVQNISKNKMSNKDKAERAMMKDVEEAVRIIKLNL